MATGKRFVVRSDKKATAFVELQRAIYAFAVSFGLLDHFGIAVGRAKSWRLPCKNRVDNVPANVAASRRAKLR